MVLEYLVWQPAWQNTRMRIFFFNDTANTEIYTSVHTLSLHDALPISARRRPAPDPTVRARGPAGRAPRRSEEHTSELQSRTLISYAVFCLKKKSLRGLLLPLSVSGLALAWTLGVLVWSGRPLKVTTLVLPSLLVSNGCSYAIHFLAQYYRSLASACGGGLALNRETHQAAVL